MRIRARLTTALAAAAAVVAIGGLTAPAASASNSYTGAAYVGGSGAYYDDWWDEGILSTSSNAQSNATCLWQKVLWAEGLLDWADIDGIFGAKTATATKAFQTKANLNPDGSAGKDTFTYAGGGLADTDFDGAVDTYIAIFGTHTFNVWRNSDGHYDFYDDGVVKSAGYNYRTCS